VNVLPVNGVDEGIGTGAGLEGIGEGARRAAGAAFRDADLRFGDRRARALRAGLDFRAAFLRPVVPDRLRFEALPAAFFRRGAFRLDRLFATVSPPHQRLLEAILNTSQG